MKPEKLWSILLAVISTTNIDADSILSTSRKRPIVDARFLLIGVARKHDFSLKEIGRFLNRDHTTILNGERVFADLYRYNEEFKQQANKVQQQLNLIYTTIATMKNVKFEDEPELWPEEFTDCFNLEKNIDQISADNAIEAALTEADHPPYFRQNNFVYTSDQLLVDAFKDQFYGQEISFRHTHIPEHYG